jgi:4-carboxymuconolactone decarboxylase
MTRLRFLTEQELTEDQRGVWEGVTAGRTGPNIERVGPHGELVGPFNAFVHAPEVGRQLSALGGHLRFKTSIERRLTEVAICTVGAHWESEFEFWAHGRMAIDHGVSADAIAALRASEVPDFGRDDERQVHAIASQLLTTNRVDDAAYAAAAELLGEAGMVELVSIIGYYCLVSLMLNLFEVALPPGESPIWPD